MLYKQDFEKADGIRAVTWFIENQRLAELEGEVSPSELHTERMQVALENASAILCNLSSVACMRNGVLYQAVIPTLVTAVLKPVAEASYTQFDSFNEDDPPPHSSVLFRNISAVIR